MSNGQLLDELRELSKKEGNISAQAHRRITLAAIAEVMSSQEEEHKRHTTLSGRIDIIEDRVSRQTKIDIIITGLLGLIGITK